MPISPGPARALRGNAGTVHASMTREGFGARVLKSVIVTSAALLLCLAPAIATAQPTSKPSPVELNAACRTPGHSVDEAGFVRIGGIRQWITIEGRDCANPVVLIVHGG